MSCDAGNSFDVKRCDGAVEDTVAYDRRYLTSAHIGFIFIIFSVCDVHCDLLWPTRHFLARTVCLCLLLSM
jgi:hypothetical protein